MKLQLTKIAALVLVISNITASNASAKMLCTQSDTSIPTMLCENTTLNGTSSVLFRNMPPWNGHSGVTIIDICEGKIPLQFEPKSGCVRRYCTQNANDLSVSFGPVTLPITPVTGVFGFSFVHAIFSINCAPF